MKVLYLDCGMGAAGDMLSAALLELCSDPDAMVKQLNAIGVPGVEYRREASVKCGITGTHLSVTVNGEEEDAYFHAHDHHDHGHEHDHHDHEHPHDHDDHDHNYAHHHHHHTGMHDIEHLVSHLSLPDAVKQDVLAVYQEIAAAESHAHEVAVSEIHFHEVGSMDAVADVAAFCLLLHTLSPERVVASPVHVGFGQVHCAHGVLPVPAPATAFLLQGIPTYGGSIEGELCTPTGAALLKRFAASFGSMPVMRVSAIGYGMGKKDFPAANCVRAMLGESEEQSGDTVVQLSCNVDDMTAEAMGFALERLYEAGALEAFTVPVGMKKSRSGLLLTVICRPEQQEELVRAIFRHTTTIGIRMSEKRRAVLDRQIETLETPYGTVRKKHVSGYGVERWKYEYEDLARIAKEQGISLAEAAALADKF